MGLFETLIRSLAFRFLRASIPALCWEEDFYPSPLASGTENILKNLFSSKPPRHPRGGQHLNRYHICFNDDTKVKGYCAVFLRSKIIFTIFQKYFFHAPQSQRPRSLPHHR
jgi:hypothetical protein